MGQIIQSNYPPGAPGLGTPARGRLYLIYLTLRIGGCVNDSNKWFPDLRLTSVRIEPVPDNDRPSAPKTAQRGLRIAGVRKRVFALLAPCIVFPQRAWIWTGVH